MAAPIPLIVSTQWLHDQLGDPRLRLLDCHVNWQPAEGGGHMFEPGREHYARGHIPGAAFADLVNDLSRRNSDLPLMLPNVEDFARAMESYGVGEGTHVVLYDASVGLWAARVWWMLAAFGFTAASVLDGGWFKWKREGRPIDTNVPAPRRATFRARPQPQLIASRSEVSNAIRDRDVCVLSALDTGAGGIAGSRTVPGQTLVDPRTNELLPRERLRELLRDAEVPTTGRVITYCDAGAFASLDALVLKALGQTDVAVYDGSLAEWRRDGGDPAPTSSTRLPGA
jgi:thiosulfate/3-mercaptopyruvate sulfurtransferase